MYKINSRTEVISKDIIAGIKYHCFYNVSQFYDRFRESLDMSRTTFFRIMQGANCSWEHAQSIMLLCQQLQITNPNGVTDTAARNQVRERFVLTLEKYLDDFKPEHLQKLKEYLKKYRNMIIYY